MEELLDQILNECRPYTKQGAVATYIPELSKQNPDDFGIYIISSDGSRFSAGDHAKHFTIQSVVKPVLLLLALMDNGVEAVRTRIGVEATGKPFDAINVSDKSLVPEHFNPMVNAGAILLCTMLKGDSYSERFARLLELIRRLADNPEIDVDEAVFWSERETGFKNRALAYLLKAHGLFKDDVEDVLECYFRACSIRESLRFAWAYQRKAAWAAASWRLHPREWASAFIRRRWMKKETASREFRRWNASPGECI